MKDNIYNLMTDEEAKEYIAENDADMYLSSFEFQNQGYEDCYLPA